MRTLKKYMYKKITIIRAVHSQQRLDSFSERHNAIVKIIVNIIFFILIKRFFLYFKDIFQDYISKYSKLLILFEILYIFFSFLFFIKRIL